VGQQPEAPQLKRRLGTFALTATGVGIILGAGIYVLIGAAAEKAGSGIWLAFALAAISASLTGLSYAELSSAFPRAGATFEYARRAFGPRIGFVAGWTMLCAAMIQVGAVALGFSGYLNDLTGVPRTPVTLGLIALAGVLLLWGIRESVSVGVAFVLVELGGLVLAITVSVPFIGDRSLTDFPLGASGVLEAAALLFFAVLGFEQMANLAEEAREPRRTLPVSIVLAIAITSSIYILVAVSSVSAVPWRELAGSDGPLALVVRVATGGEMSRVLSIIALFATGNTVLFGLLASSRQVYAMARAGALPQSLSGVGAKRGTPVAAAILVTAVAAAASLAGDIEQVAQMSNAAVLAAFVAVNLSLIRLRLSRAMPEGGFRAPLAIGRVPLLPVLGAASSAFMIWHTGLKAMLLGSALIGAGVLVTFVQPRSARPEKAGPAAGGHRPSP
jgi:APA family basic amino acid/polyamine antiporter